MKTRILVAIPMTLIVLLAIFVQGWVLAVFAVVLALFAEYEVIRALMNTKHAPIRSIPTVSALVFAILFLQDFARPQESSAYMISGDVVLTLLVAAVMAAFLWTVLRTSQTFDGMLGTVFTLVYPQLFVLCFYVVVLHTKGIPDPALRYELTILAMLMLFVPPVFSDTLAYFWGRKFGRTKLSPVISPNKTVAGSVAGLVGGAIGALLVWWGISAIPAFPAQVQGGPVQYLIIGAVMAALSQIGDLSASFIKRTVGVKDFGHLLPGHGGVMDRIDSTMFVMPVLAALVAIGLVGVRA